MRRSTRDFLLFQNNKSGLVRPDAERTSSIISPAGKISPAVIMQLSSASGPVVSVFPDLDFMGACPFHRRCGARKCLAFRPPKKTAFTWETAVLRVSYTNDKRPDPGRSSLDTLLAAYSKERYPIPGKQSKTFAQMQMTKHCRILFVENSRYFSGCGQGRTRRVLCSLGQREKSE